MCNIRKNEDNHDQNYNKNSLSTVYSETGSNAQEKTEIPCKSPIFRMPVNFIHTVEANVYPIFQYEKVLNSTPAS